MSVVLRKVTLLDAKTVTVRTLRRVLNDALGQERAAELLASMGPSKWRYLDVVKVEPPEVETPSTEMSRRELKGVTTSAAAVE